MEGALVRGYVVVFEGDETERLDDEVKCGVEAVKVVGVGRDDGLMCAAGADDDVRLGDVGGTNSASSRPT